jgi:glycosyltransferase involved in cell wall biosynthesis
MRILIIGQLKGFHIPVSGGPERAFKNQIIAFSKYGSKHTFTAVLIGFKEPQIPSFSQSILLYPTRYDFIDKPVFSVYIMHLRKKIKDIVEDTEPDLVFLHDPFYIMLLPHNISNISTFLHGPFWLQGTIIYSRYLDFTRLLYRKLIIEKMNRIGLKKSNNIICVTKYLKEVLPQDIKLKTLVLENPVDEKFLNIVRNPFREKEVITILTVGRFAPVKGYETLLYGINRLLKIAPYLRSRIRVRIVALYQRSFDWYYRKIQRLINLFNLNNLFEIIANIPSDKALLKEYSSADIYVHSSFSEGLPNAIQEAMASQLPIIASRVGGIPDVISNGYNGLLFEPGDAHSLAEHLLKVIDNKDYREALGKNARQTAAFRWHPHVYTERFEKILGNLYEQI